MARVGTGARSMVSCGLAAPGFEDGEHRRDFVHADDVARANVLALTSPDPIEGALNVRSGQPRTVGELAGIPRPRSFRQRDRRLRTTGHDVAATALR